MSLFDALSLISDQEILFRVCDQHNFMIIFTDISYFSIIIYDKLKWLLSLKSNISLLCFQYLSENSLFFFLLDALHRRSKFANFYRDLMYFFFLFNYQFNNNVFILFSGF